MGAVVSFISRFFSARPRRVALRPELAHDALLPLPLSLVLAVAGWLPSDDRLRLAFVSPAFRAVADDTSLYQDVQLGVGSGVVHASDALLRAVSAKARGTMRMLDVSGLMDSLEHAVTFDAVVAVCEASAGTLEAVDARHDDDPDGWHLNHTEIARLLAAVPLLRRLDAGVECSLGQLYALLLLHSGVLRVRRLHAERIYGDAAVAALVAAVEAQPSVSQLGLRNAPLHTVASLDAVVGLSLARRLAALQLIRCRLGAASMPALTRLLGRESGLVSLTVINNNPINGDNALPPSPAFCAALRASTLQRLVLVAVRLFDNLDAGFALLAAATGHPSLQLLSVGRNRVADAHRAAVGVALGVLVASSAPSLTSLNVCICRLGDAGLASLVAALAGNTALRSLDIGENYVTHPLGVALLAAVGTSTGLRKLKANEEEWDDDTEEEEEENEVGPGVEWPEIAEAEALVAARA